MIKNIQFIEGFPLQLPHIGNRKFEFTDGINLLIGGNGTGKSVILKTLKGYCGIKTGGWTQPSIPNEIGIGRLGGHGDYPHAYATYTPANCKALVFWNGLPSFFNDGDVQSNALFTIFNMKQHSDGITNVNDIEKQLKECPSAGQYRAQKLNKVLNMLKDGPPEYTIHSHGELVKVDMFWAKREFEFWRYLSKLYNDTYKEVGKTTVMFDEPERSLSHAKQKEFFLNVVPNQLKGYQVIMATHSLYAAFCPGANIIEMEDGYIKSFKEAVQDIAKLAKLEEPTNLPTQLELGI